MRCGWSGDPRTRIRIVILTLTYNNPFFPFPFSMLRCEYASSYPSFYKCYVIFKSRISSVECTTIFMWNWTAFSSSKLNSYCQTCHEFDLIEYLYAGQLIAFQLLTDAEYRSIFSPFSQSPLEGSHGIWEGKFWPLRTFASNLCLMVRSIKSIFHFNFFFGVFVYF